MILPPGGFFTLGSSSWPSAWWRGRKAEEARPRSGSGPTASGDDRGKRRLMGELFWILISAMLVNNFTLASVPRPLPLHGRICQASGTALRGWAPPTSSCSYDYFDDGIGRSTRSYWRPLRI